MKKEADKRHETNIKAIEEQGKMTPELLNKLNNAYQLQELEDLYLPYKQKPVSCILYRKKDLSLCLKLIFEQKVNNFLQKSWKLFERKSGFSGQKHFKDYSMILWLSGS